MRLRGVGPPLTRPATPGWLREVAELAAVFVTVGAAHLLANLLGHQQHGPILLIALGVALVATAAILRGALRRRARHANPAPHTTPATPAGPASPAGPGHHAGSAAHAGSAPHPGSAPHAGPLHHSPTVRRWLQHAGRRAPVRLRTGEATALWRIRTTVNDAPGALAVLADSLSHLTVNILAVELHPLGHAVTDELIVEAPHRIGAAELAATIRTGHGADIWVGPADAHDLTDLPARILGLAARVVADADELPIVLHELYRGAMVSWSLRSGTEPALDGTTMRLDDPYGGRLTLTRPDLPFSPAELARARALVDLTAIGIHPSSRADPRG
jgi:hypothetical protein